MMRSLAPWVVVLVAAMLLAPLAAGAREDADLSITSHRVAQPGHSDGRADLQHEYF